MTLADGLDISKSFANKKNPNNRSMISDSMKIINLLQILRKNRIESQTINRLRFELLRKANTEFSDSKTG